MTDTLHRIRFQTGTHRALDGAVYVFVTWEHPLVRGVAFVTVLEYGKVPVVYSTVVFQATNVADTPSDVSVQVEIAPPVARDVETMSAS